MTGFVGFALSVKEWTTRAPSVEAARPARCVQCGGAKATAERQTIVGHGLRHRTVVDLACSLVEVVLRRYRCRECGAVMTVGPAVLSPRRSYTLGAIALALGLWSLAESTSFSVRARVSPQRTIGDGTIGRWPVLRRWARSAPERFGVLDVDEATPRVVSARVCRALAARAPPAAHGLVIVDRVVSGAVGQCVEGVSTMRIAAA
ncbi:MAG: transposase family protein [Myxococcales bacterium]|nr:transposase family protein [Myxococcales bacterium]